MFALEGTIRYPHPTDESSVDLIKGVRKAMYEEVKKGSKMVVIENQSGPAFGAFSKEKVVSMFRETERKLGLAFDRTYFCYSHPNAKVEELRRDSRFRKPRPGMFEEMLGDFEVKDGVDIVFVGSTQEDVDFALACRRPLIRIQDFIDGSDRKDKEG